MQQQEQQKILLPFFAEQEGFDVELDTEGNLTSISRRADPDEAKRKELETAFLDRSLAAMRGELPVDPALEDSLAAGEQQLREKLQTQFGPGYETSSPAIESLEQFRQSAETLRSEARTGQLTLAEQLGITREQQRQFTTQSSADALRTSAIGDPLTFAGAFGQVARGYGQAQVPYQQQRQMQVQASISNRQQNMALIGAGIGAAGTIFGGRLSDADLKGDLVLISHTKHGIPIYAYTRIDTGERMIGVLSRDVEPVIPGAVATKHGYDVVDYEMVT